MRLALIGPGDIELHYQKLLKIPKAKFNSEVEKIAQSIVNSGLEIECLPDRGISFQIAKLYKQKGGLPCMHRNHIIKTDCQFGYQRR